MSSHLYCDDMRLHCSFTVACRLIFDRVNSTNCGPVLAPPLSPLIQSLDNVRAVRAHLYRLLARVPYEWSLGSSVRRRRKTSTRPRSQIPCVVVEKKI